MFKRQKGRVGPNKGRKFSAETRAKMSSSKKGKVGNINTIIATSKRMETVAERSLHKALLILGIPFTPHYPVLDRYVCDIYLPQLNIILEADGWSHTDKCHFYKPEKEKQRDQEITATGVRLIHIPNSMIDNSPPKAIQWAIEQASL